MRPNDGSPTALLAHVHEALASGDVSALEEWSDVVGWVQPDATGPNRPDTADAPDRLLGVAEVRRRTGLGRTTLWNHERAGTFPRRVQLTTGRVAWRESDVAQWIVSRPPR